MQTGQLKEMVKGKSLPAPIQKALQVLHLRDIANMQTGRVEIAGEDMYADVFDAVTRRYGGARAVLRCAVPRARSGAAALCAAGHRGRGRGAHPRARSDLLPRDARSGVYRRRAGDGDDLCAGGNPPPDGRSRRADGDPQGGR